VETLPQVSIFIFKFGGAKTPSLIPII